MRHRLLSLIIVATFALLMEVSTLLAQQTPQTAADVSQGRPAFVPGEIVVKTRPSITFEGMHSSKTTLNSKVLEKNHTMGLYRLKVAKPVKEEASYYESHPGVEWAKPNYIIAEVGDDYVTLMDMEFVIQNMLPAFRQRYTNPQVKERLLRQLVNDKLFSRAARDDNLSNLPEVQRKINLAVNKTLALEYRTRMQALTVSDEELKAFYNANRGRFVIPERITGRRILVETEQVAEEILALLKTGASFEELAKERSKDPTAANGGGFGWLARGQMVPAVEQVAFVLREGEISGIIPTKFGHYIIKVEGKQGPNQRTFSEVSNQIEQRLKAEKRKEQLDKEAGRLKEKYQVTIHTELLSEVEIPVTEVTSQEDVLKVLRQAIDRPY